MESPKKTAVVILTYNNLKYNQDCLDSIRSYTESGACEIIVVDNGSTDGTREWLRTQTDIKLLLNEENAGFPKGCNQGIAMAEKDSDILLLNNDTVVTSRWLENLRKCLYSSDEIGAVGAVCNKNDNLQGMGWSYDSLDEMQKLAAQNNISDPGRWEEKVFLIGFCILIKRKVLDEIGPLDEAYTPGYVEDNDFSLRILTAGYKLMLCHDCFIHHYLGTEFRKDLSRFYPILYKNRRLFESKWGFSPFAFDEIKYASLRVFDEPDKSRPIKVLELGCGIGVTLLKLKKDYPNAELYGIEPDESKAKIARHVARVSCRPPENFPLNFPEDFFDDIFIDNLPETAGDPGRLLRELRKYLKEGGRLICEIQNIMHYSVLRNLLKGSWQNGEEDTLTKSNRTFFTLEDIHRLFTDSGYRNPYILHWYSVPTEDEKGLIEKLAAAGNETRTYLYKTRMFSVVFEK